MSQQDTSDQTSRVPTTPSNNEFGMITSSANIEEKEELNVADEQGALAQETGSTGKSERGVAKDAMHEYLADMMYDSDEALPREYNQNAETAVIRAAKLLITYHPDYGADWLTRSVTLDSGRVIELPRPLDRVLEVAKTLGYDPTIEVDLYHDDRKLVYEDPGIGMTAHELDKAFNVTGKSGVSYDSDTGGKMGVGALTYVKAAGMDGDMEGYTATRKPDAKDIDRKGITFLADIQGVEEIPNKTPDGFQGTRFEIPILEKSDGGFYLENFKDWIAKYSQALRVPLLYKEHKGGETIVEEEYGGETLEEMYNDPPIVVDRPGEYTVVAGPNIPTGYDEPDCFLISMPIERNTRISLRSLWNVVVQIHNEQGLIVEGPNRGRKEEEVDLEPDDVPLPQPTADRDRLQRDMANKRFFKHIKEVVKERELEVAAEFLDNIDGPKDVLTAPQENPQEWKTFRKILRKHGPHSVTNNLKRFTRFLQQSDNKFRTYDDEMDGLTIDQWEQRCQKVREVTDDDAIEVIGTYDIPETYQKIHGLFDEFSYAPRNGHRVSRKKGREDKELGHLLADTAGSDIYMAASTGGKFKDRAKVIWNTLDSGEVIVVDGVNKYSTYNDLYGFQKLKDVPCRRGEDENDEWDIPDSIHNNNKRVADPDKKNNGKPDNVENHILKLRTSNSHSIDARKSVSVLRDRFSEDGNGFGRRNNLILFPRSIDKNISDNYTFADHAAIASCTNEEYEELADCENVFLPDEFEDKYYSTVIATEEGGMTIRSLLDEDRQVILAYVNDIEGKKLITDERKRLREYLTEDLQNQVYWGSDDKKDTLWAVIEQETFYRIGYPLDKEYVSKQSMIGYRYCRNLGSHLDSYTLDKSIKHYERLINTPNWDDDSKIYSVIDSLSYNKGHSEHLKEVIMALHDLNIDITTMDHNEVRDAVKLMCDN